MTAWFRFYEAALDDPKVQTLPASDFKSWVNILCVACRNDGVLPSIPSLAFMLRMSQHDCETLIERLSNAGLIDRRNGGPNGSRYAPHGWEKRQYKSDTSTERVKRFRRRSEAVSETPPDTDTDTDIPEAKASGSTGLSAVSQTEPNRLLWGEGLSILSGITGKPAEKLRSTVGQWVKLAGGDHAAILRIIIDARARGIVDPLSWISASVKPKDPDAEIYRGVL